jgi:hypothetical protein
VPWRKEAIDWSTRPAALIERQGIVTLLIASLTSQPFYDSIVLMARELSETLEEAQKWGIITYPYLIAKIRRKWGGVIRYDFEQLYYMPAQAEERILGLEGDATDGASHNLRFWLDRFQAEKSGWVDQIRVYSGASYAEVKVAIYADDGGEPGELLSAQNSAYGGYGWNDVPIPAVYLTEGQYYWLAHYPYNDELEYRSGTTNVRYKATSDPGFTFPDPAGSGFTTVTDKNNMIAGWQSGTMGEYDGPHCATIPSDGSLIRLRVTESGDSRKLYYQRIVDPDDESDFSSWSYLSKTDIIAVAACSYGTKVFQCYIDGDREVYYRESNDCGASWGSWTLLTTAASIAIYGLTCAYKPNGDVGMFWIDQETIVREIRVGGSWGGKVNYNPFGEDLSGITVIYNEDWELVVTGKDASLQWTVWSVVFGDGNRVAAGTWSDFEVIIARETTEPYEYYAPFLARTDTTRLYFVEKFTDAETSEHIFYSQMPPSAHHDESLWLEPVPMEPESINGLAICEDGAHAWLTNANSVYWADSTDDELDITSKLLIVDANQSPDIQRGTLKISVDNTAGLYNSFARLGDEITLGIGYKTGAGDEYSLMSSFWITHYELRSPEYKFWYAIFAPGILGTLYVEAQDAWDFLRRYKTRRPYSWAEDEKSVLELLKFFFARAGLDFVVLSSSDAVNNFKPEFSKNRGTRYSTIVRNLLKMIPDQVFQRESTIYLRNPTEAESVDWTYHNLLGTANLLYRGKYGTSAQDPNRAEVWTETEMKAGADWDQLSKVRDRLSRVVEPVYPDLTRAGERVDAELRRAEVLTGEKSWLFAPVNCGLEPWDKLQITDQVAGVADIIRRAIRLKFHWDAKNWDYSQQVILGAD